MAPQDAEVVHEGGEDSLHGPKHGAEAQVEQHEEEQCGPEGAGWEERHHLGERYERQARPFNPLQAHKEHRGWWQYVQKENLLMSTDGGKST